MKMKFSSELLTAFVQCRDVSFVVEMFRLLQPIADGFQLILNEPVSRSIANFFLFRMTPVASFMLNLV